MKNETDDLLVHLHNHEWLSTFLIRTRLRPVWTAILVAVVNTVVNFSIAAFTNTFFTNASGLGFFSDYMAWSYYLIFWPVVYGSYCWFQSAGQKLFGKLLNGGSLERSKELQETLQKLRNRLQNKWLPRGAWVFSLVSTALSTIAFLFSNQSWGSSSLGITVTHSIMDIVNFYVVSIVAFNGTVILISINEIFRHQKIIVQPFHPDKAGGMGEVGRFTANAGYIIAPLGITIMFLLLQLPSLPMNLYKALIILMSASYIFTAPICFFIPLLSVHSAMVSNRDELIKKVSDEFNEVFAKLSSKRDRKTEQAEDLLKKIRQLDEERELISKFPVWPYNSASFRKFFGLVLSPIVPVLTSLILDLVSKLI